MRIVRGFAFKRHYNVSFQAASLSSERREPVQRSAFSSPWCAHAKSLASTFANHPGFTKSTTLFVKISIKIDAMTSHLVYLALGSNLGDRMANLRAAAAALSPALTVRRVSPVYQTSPWGVTDQPDFLNQVIEVETRLTPLDLLVYLKHLERELGRVPTVRYGPRLIDLDILFFNQDVINLPELTIPHPRLAERAFVLVPLADLVPGLMHPELKRTVAELLANVDRSGVAPYVE